VLVEAAWSTSTDCRMAPEPETVPLWQDRLRELGGQVPARWPRPRPIEIRHVASRRGVRAIARATQTAGDGVDAGRRQPLKTDPIMHVCAVACPIDMTLLDSAQSWSLSAWHGPRTP
jgi:acyl-CoA thioesterase